MTASGSDVVIVLTTTDDAADARRLAAIAVEDGLAACVQISAITSVYRWEGEVHDEAELQLWCKTTMTRASALTARLVEAHSYDVPEVLVVPVDGGHGPYLDWVVDQTSS